jgi:hypothetical protein
MFASTAIVLFVILMRSSDNQSKMPDCPTIFHDKSSDQRVFTGIAITSGYSRRDTIRFVDILKAGRRRRRRWRRMLSRIRNASGGVGSKLPTSPTLDDPLLQSLFLHTSLHLGIGRPTRRRNDKVRKGKQVNHWHGKYRQYLAVFPIFTPLAGFMVP